MNVKDKERLNIYMKNCCVALLSAKHYNQDSDVALVTNIDVPNEFEQILKNYDIISVNAEFNEFKFSNEYKWGLAFYKMCVLKYII